MKALKAWLCLALLLLLTVPALAEEDWPQPYTGDLVGTWCFVGGGEVNGDGFRLNADGTGCILSIADNEQFPPVLTDTVLSTFTWEITVADGYQVLHERFASGTVASYPVERWDNTGRIHLPAGDGGGFYMPYLDDLVVSSTPTRTPLVLTAVRGDFAPDQSFAVYESPRGEELRRAGNGKAKVSTNGESSVYGNWLGALLVEYEISADRHRIGWIEAEMADAPDLAFTDANGLYLCGVVTVSVALTDDPLYSRESIAVMSGGTSVHVLGQLDDWLLVEGFIGDEVRMGFVPVSAVDMQSGYTADVRYVIDHAGAFTEADIRAAMDAVCACFRADWAGSALKVLRYVDADNTDPNRWWAEDGMESILLYADLSSMELWDFEIAGSIAKDYLFILYRTAEGGWVVSNWGYT